MANSDVQPKASLRTNKPPVYGRLELRVDPLRFCRPRIEPRDGRHASIAKAAYMRAQRRNFEPGHELEDWLAAEAEFDRRVTR